MTSKKLWIKAILLGFIISVGFYMYFGSKYRNRLLNEEPTYYTVGEIVGFQRGAKVSPWFIYYFYDGQDLRKGTYSINNSLRKESDSYLRRTYVGKKYLIKYSASSPRFNEMYLNIPIPDSLWNCEKCTWAILPEWVQKNKEIQVEEKERLKR